MLRKGMTDEQAEAEMLREGVESRIRRLRTLVDQIELQAADRLAQAERGQGRYTGVAEVFVKELTQGLVNIGMEQLVHYATIADVYHTEAEMEQKSEGRE